MGEGLGWPVDPADLMARVRSLTDTDPIGLTGRTDPTRRPLHTLLRRHIHHAGGISHPRGRPAGDDGRRCQQIRFG